jgi:hypothetical protein
LPGAMMGEPIAAIAVGANRPDDRRDTRLGVVGNRRALGVDDVADVPETLTPAWRRLPAVARGRS